VKLGSEIWCLLAFSDAETLRVIIPPESIQLFSENPRDITLMPSNVFRGRILKLRKVGRLLNFVLEVGGIELNALVLGDSDQHHVLGPGDEVFVSISPVALSTETHNRAKGSK
jgi:ABC-type molybdate transport system ATPase subunit